MGLSLWNMFKAGLLLTNAIMILNRKRFLSKYGFMDMSYLAGGPTSNSELASQRPLQAQIVGLIHAVHYLKVPIIACNVITIVFEMLLGGT